MAGDDGAFSGRTTLSTSRVTVVKTLVSPVLLRVGGLKAGF